MSTEFFEAYQSKLRTLSELKELLGPFPREMRVILCHGVFDVVHPGHLRHLAFAKTKADILVVSLTSDKHIRKGIYRPHIPERLRALNLAALEMVDHVLIDEEPTPLRILASLQPDYFAKGFEYSAKGLPQATQEEKDVIQAYGGQMIFTPGDIVYSSSKFLNLTLPQIQLEKLLMLMHQNKISFDALRATLKRFSEYRVHVVGDTIVDSYTRTTLIGGQTKTPTLSVLQHGQEQYIGGAAIVCQHLRAAGAQVTFSTVLGDDPLKDFVVNGLRATGVIVNATIDKTRPTTNKNVFIAGGYRLLKVDTLDNQPIADNIVHKITHEIRVSEADGVIFSDFRHGIFNALSIQPFINALPPSTFKVADSQVASRWGNITEFTGFDLITPNEREARFAVGDQDSTVGRLASLLHGSSAFKNLILKLGDRGVFCMTHSPNAGDPYFSIDSFATNVIDPVGAGDALLAYATVSMLATGSLVISSILGSMAAAAECELDGNIPITPMQVMEKIDAVERMIGYGDLKSS